MKVYNSRDILDIIDDRNFYTYEKIVCRGDTYKIINRDYTYLSAKLSGKTATFIFTPYGDEKLKYSVSFDIYYAEEEDRHEVHNKVGPDSTTGELYAFDIIWKLLIGKYPYEIPTELCTDTNKLIYK